MRWADLDLLGHVNNVVYVDYLQEARVDMLRHHDPGTAAADALAEGVVVVRHEVSYLEPMAFRLRPVSIECWVTDIRAATFTMAYEVFDESPEGRTVYLRASTVLAPYVFATERPRRLSEAERDSLGSFLAEGPRGTARLDPVDGWEPGTYPLHVRFSDVDVYRHVNNVKYFEYYQEARIPMMRAVAEGVDGAAGVQFVVAQTDVDYLAPILFRHEPYAVASRITHVGSRSFVISSEIRDGERVLSRARVVVVFFDAETQRSVEPAPEYRDALVAAMNG